MRRSQRDAAASALVNSATTTAGPSLLDTIEELLLIECRKYRNLKNADCSGVEIAVKRGKINGLAVAVAKIRLPYEDQKAVVRQIEREFIMKAKEL